jgi:hypothetical protein
MGPSSSHSEHPGYRDVVVLSQRLSDLVGCYVHVITDDVPAPTPGRCDLGSAGRHPREHAAMHLVSIPSRLVGWRQCQLAQVPLRVDFVERRLGPREEGTGPPDLLPEVLRVGSQHRHDDALSMIDPLAVGETIERPIAPMRGSIQPRDAVRVAPRA